MRISGFTILRNAVRLDYPFQESLRSLLPLVDELIVGVGDGDDGTWDAVAAIADPKLKPFRSPWGAPTAAGEVLSEQTNRALARCAGDWAIYLQADEVLHEDDLDRVRGAMRRHLDGRVEGLLFRYHHFWQHPSIEADCWESFYPTAVRAVRLGRGVASIGDAAGFGRVVSGRTRGLIKAHVDARVFHYGWCNAPARQLERTRSLRQWYADEPPVANTPEQMFWTLPVRAFRDTHPRVMRDRLAAWPAWRGAAPPRHATAAARAWLAVLRSPRAAATGWARPMLPVALTNLWWQLSDRRVRS